jgi:hypothetical protein
MLLWLVAGSLSDWAPRSGVHPPCRLDRSNWDRLHVTIAPEQSIAVWPAPRLQCSIIAFAPAAEIPHLATKKRFERLTIGFLSLEVGETIRKANKSL